MLVLLVVAEAGIAISLFMFSGEAKGMMGKFMNQSMVSYNNGGAVKEGWDHVQKDFECCGFKGHEDWKDIMNNTKKIAPKSCCKKPGQCIMDITSQKVFPEGCGEKFEGWLEAHVTLAGGFIITVAILQLFSIIIACCFARKNQQEKTLESV